MTFITKCVAVPLATAALIASTNVSAQETKSDNSTYISDLKTCQTIADDAARLSCYDAAVGTVVTASEEGAVRIISEEEVVKTRRGLFGLGIDLFGSTGEEGDLDLFESIITNVSVSGNTVYITIEDGAAVWQIKNARSRTKRAEPGDPVIFKKAALGSYFVRIDGNIGERGTRIR